MESTPFWTEFKKIVYLTRSLGDDVSPLLSVFTQRLVIVSMREFPFPLTHKDNGGVRSFDIL